MLFRSETVVQYNDSYDWPAQPPVGIYFNYGLVDEFMHEWLLRQQELHAREITRDEYFEWKLNWPATCDGGRESQYYIPVSYTHLDVYKRQRNHRQNISIFPYFSLQ